MIEIYADKTGGRYRLYARGHAEPSEDRDIVCAGVSALIEGLVLYAKGRAACRHLRCNISSGEVFLACRGGLEGAFEATLCGLLHICRLYPAHLKFFGSVDDKSKKQCYNRRVGHRADCRDERKTV